MSAKLRWWKFWHQSAVDINFSFMHELSACHHHSAQSDSSLALPHLEFLSLKQPHPYCYSYDTLYAPSTYHYPPPNRPSHCHHHRRHHQQRTPTPTNNNNNEIEECYMPSRKQSCYFRGCLHTFPVLVLRRPVRFAGKHVHRPAKFLRRGSCRLEHTSTWPPLTAQQSPTVPI